MEHRCRAADEESDMLFGKATRGIVTDAQHVNRDAADVDLHTVARRR